MIGIGQTIPTIIPIVLPPDHAGLFGVSPDGWVAIFTFALVVVSALQGVAILRAERTSRDAADAAKRSADAIAVIERAHVYPVVIHPGAILSCIQSAQAFWLDEPDGAPDKPCDVTAELAFKIVNYGKTPAILKTVFVDYGFYPSGALIGVGIQRGILGPGEETENLPSVMQRGLTRNEANHIGTYTGHIAFEGQINFFDVWDNEFITKFHFVWEPSARQMQLADFSTKRVEEAAK